MLKMGNGIVTALVPDPGVVFGKYTLTLESEEVLILLGERAGLDYIVHGGYLTPNRHEEPKFNFRVNKSDVPSELHDHIIGVSHTHVRNVEEHPSMEDLRGLGLFQIGMMYHVPRATLHLYSQKRWLDKCEWRKTS